MPVGSAEPQLGREAIRQRGDFVGTHRVLTTAAGAAGHTEIAAAALQELSRAQPNISLPWIADEMPIMQGGELEHYLEALSPRALGLGFAADADQTQCETVPVTGS